MRRTRRNLIALLLTLAMILSLTACGSKKEDTSAPATESPSAEAPAETQSVTIEISAIVRPPSSVI